MRYLGLILVLLPCAVAFAPPHPMRTAFERAIALHGDDDLPKLVYADWLDENDDAHRAEYTRLEVELLRLPMDAPHRRALEERSRVLFRENHDTWFPPVAGVRGFVLRAGFVDRIVVDHESDVAAAKEAFPSARVVEVADVERAIATAPLTVWERQAIREYTLRVSQRLGRSSRARSFDRNRDGTNTCPSILRALAAPRD